MADESDTADDQDSAATVGHDLGAERTTAPMSEFGARDAAAGALVLAVGLAIAVGIPIVAL